ncbi:cysteinyl-tRNA synthetase [Thermotoga sp. Ku-13t]|uniref:cysteine--tRNA ligase n=1 Tax=Thermotoga sp. Ku-13t TaxID=1755813 RepID=UPI0013EB03A6|nr:cysteine--tRNA ligase [Thermotoga sp. Ku-13t]KAF2958192.1 cysteinyl-tRNA synthetase [Thermotoga sp. Ku-13t]
MFLKNTLSGRLEKLETLEPGVVRMYVCGPTVYGLIHVGNARPMIVFDALRRYFEYRGYRVIMVQNFTDIDDKIINRANEWNVDFKDVAEAFIQEYWRDASALGVRAPNFAPKTSDFVPEIVNAIEQLVRKGHAYVVDGDVYFDVKSFPKYGELSHRSLDEMIAGARVEVSEKKRFPLDFALWKAAKSGEPSWDSPWGKGRPGWHIECTIMSTKLLGSTLDIHAGGEDLIFPHHENEKAQSEALTGKPFVRYWLHNALVRVSGDKMSKSLGNIFILREALKKFGADGLKLYFLSKHYRSPIDFSIEALEASAKAARRIAESFRNFESRFSSIPVPKSDAWMSEQRQKFVEALDDDFNTPKAVAQIFELVGELNKFMSEANEEKALKTYHLLRREFCSVLGLFEAGAQSQETELDPFVRLILDVRKELRERKLYDLADSIRDRLKSLGIEVRDTREGSTYSFLKEV